MERSVSPRDSQQFFELFMQSQYWPRDRLAELQRENLATLLRHARKFVPFYDGRLDPLFTGSDAIDWDRWPQIPIMRRADLLTQSEQMRALALPGYHGKIYYEKTSGSTGEALTIAKTGYTNMAMTGAMYRAHVWHNFDWSKNFAMRSGGSGHPTHNVKDQLARRRHWGPPWMPQARGVGLHFETTVGTQEMLRLVQAHDIRYLGARPARAQALAIEAQQLGIDVQLDAVWAFGTATSREAREDCMAAFGAKIVSLYSSKEGQFMAVQCPSGTHFHVNDETTLVEIVDEDGRRCAPGELGRVVVTPLFNFAQPIIRYDQGDLAVAGAACACGRPHTVIERIVGRATHLFVLPDGRRFLPNIPLDIGERVGARFWQIAQTGPLSIEFRYVAAAEHTANAALAISGIIRAGTDAAVTVEVRRMDDLPRTESGKYIDYVNEYAPARPD